jgi:hypothetical protein
MTFRQLGWLPATLVACAWSPLPAGAAEGFDQSHALFGRVLSNFVANARVDYAALKTSPGDLDRYLSDVAVLTPEEFAKWPEPDRLALLLNLYNAQTLRLIIDHYPLKSIRDIGLLPGAAWRRSIVRFGGEVMSLDRLEHEVIRGRYDEPRIHFAVVCAAVSCPPLRNEPYVGARLGEQLDDQTRTFLADAEKNRYDAATESLWLSAIFDWYQDDFTKPAGSLEAYVKPFLPAEVAAATGRARQLKVRFLEYDWALNEVRP